MSELRARLRAAEIEVVSPRGVLQLAGTGSGTFEVAITPGGLRGWTDATLAHEITGLVEATMSAVRRTYVETRRSAQAEAPTVPTESAAEPEEHEEDYSATDARDPAPTPGRAARFRAALDTELTGLSQLGHVALTRTPDHQFTTEVRPGTLRKLDEPTLAEEIHSVLNAMWYAYQEQFTAAHYAVFGDSPGAAR